MNTAAYKHQLDYVLSFLEKNPRPLTEKSFRLARERHMGKKRLDGSPAIVHMIEVAYYMILFGFDDDLSLAAAFDHDGIEDEVMTFEDIVNAVNELVAKFVQRLSKKKEITKEEFIDYIGVVMSEIRTLFIKFIDRFANVKRSFIGYFSLKNTERYIEETWIMIEMLENFIAEAEKEGTEKRKYYYGYCRDLRLLRGFIKGMIQAAEQYVIFVKAVDQATDNLEKRVEELLAELA